MTRCVITRPPHPPTAHRRFHPRDTAVIRWRVLAAAVNPVARTCIRLGETDRYYLDPHGT